MRISDWSSDVCSSDLQQNELWSKFANQTGDLRKETGTLTGKSEAASRDADVLAGEAARDDINVGNSIGSKSICCEFSNVMIARHLRPMFLEYTAGKFLDLAERDGFKSASPLKTQREAADA